MQPNFFVVEDNFNHLWVHPRSGGFSEFFRKKKILKPFYNDPSDPNRRFFNTMHAAYYDKHGTLWLSTRSSGLLTAKGALSCIPQKAKRLAF